jgi:amidohydrolase
MPDKAVDPIVVAAQLITLLQTIASREVAPHQPVVVTVGSLHAGTTFNVIPDRAELQGTVRAFDEAVRRELPERIERLIGGLCNAMRLDFRFAYRWVYPPTINDPQINAIVREAARGVVGAENVVDPHEIVMWSEDMSFMQQERPGAYFLIGARGPSSLEPHHSALFDIDERALKIGADMMVALGLHE